MSSRSVIDPMFNPIISKFSRLRDNQIILAQAREIKTSVKEVFPSQKVIIFNASTRLEQLSQNAAFSLLAAWSLALDGTRIVFFACNRGMTRCMLGTNPDQLTQEPPCGKCTAQTRRMYHKDWTDPFGFASDDGLEAGIGDLPLQELLKVQYDGIPLGEIVLPSLRWILRRHNLIDDEATRSICRDFLRSALSVARSFNRVLENHNPAAVVVFNGQFFPEATAKYLAEKRGIRVISHEVALQPLSAFFTSGEATAYPIHISQDFELDAVQNQNLDAVLEKRFQGSFSMAGIQFWADMQPLGEDFWRRANKFEQIVPVFTNVIFDTSQAHANVLYQDMFAWLEDVARLIEEHPRTFFVIRAHPDEARPGKEARESVSSWVKERKLDERENVLFIPPQNTFSSYDLIRKSKFVMVYNSTIGLEASILGAAVLCAGKARFTQVESVFFPKTRAEYLVTAGKFLKDPVISIPPQYQKNARIFLYFQLFRTSLPFGDFLEESGYWKGYVRLKDFPPENLRAENSETMRVIQDGILTGKEFLIPE